MRTAKLLGAAAALIAAALVGGTLIGSALAQSSPSPTTGTAKNAAYCQTFLDTFASKLGVSSDALLPAAKAAATAAVDAAVKAGDLTADVGAAMKTRITAANGDGCALLGGARFGHVARKVGRHVLGGDLLDAAAGALKLSTEALTTELRSGKTLKEVAAAHSVDYATVSKAVLDAAKADFDKAVAAGNLTQERADQMLSRLSGALSNGSFPKGKLHGGGG